MLVEAVVLGDIAVVTQSGDVVLSAIDNALLHTGVDIAVAHNGSGAAQAVHHVDGHLAVHGADLQALQVSRGADGGSLGVERASAGIQPGQAAEALIIGGLKDSLCGIAVHVGVVVILIVEDIRHGESVVLLAEVAQRGSGDLSHVQSAGLDLGDHIRLAAQGAVGDDLDVDSAVGLLLDLLRKAGQLDVNSMVLSQVVAQLQVEAAACSSCRAGSSSAACCRVVGRAAASGEQSRSACNCQDLNELSTRDFHSGFPFFFLLVYTTSQPVGRETTNLECSGQDSPRWNRSFTIWIRSFRLRPHRLLGCCQSLPVSLASTLANRSGFAGSRLPLGIITAIWRLWNR